MRHIEKPYNVPEELKTRKIKSQFNKTVKNGTHQAKDNAYTAVKPKLKKLYKYKCAYCETSLYRHHSHVEHFRPKNNSYYWLAYSWDNLLLSCEVCNSKKGQYFPLEGTQARYQGEDLSELHHKSPEYDTEEHPVLVNPERENPEDLYEWQPDGTMKAKNRRMDKTIKQLGLNDTDLYRERQTLFHDLIQDIHEELFKAMPHEEASSKDKQEAAIKAINSEMQKFIRKTTETAPYLSWRKAIIRHSDWLWQGIYSE